MTLKPQAAQRRATRRTTAWPLIKAVIREWASSFGQLIRLVACALALGLVCAAQAQNTSILVSNPQSKPYDIHVRDKDGKARVELKASGNKLMFVRLSDSPANVQVA
ncbi:MAG TPA: hypothetical protein VKA60_17260, partial [Blastocatellia bacterium]|nr:hypothetical protein [Blastocatellia bacterium]